MAISSLKCMRVNGYHHPSLLSFISKPSSISPPQTSQPIVITARNLTVPFNIASILPQIYQISTNRKKTTKKSKPKSKSKIRIKCQVPSDQENHIPYASPAFSNGNSWTKHSIFSSSVNWIASSESVAWPEGQDWMEVP